MTFDTPTLQTELERILISRCFRSRRVLRKFLRYIVEESLAGNATQLTQTSIAIHGLGQHKSFDDLDNPLVRVQAGRLRKQLEDYYATEGRFDPIRIELPVGSYQPIFHQHLRVSEEPEQYLSQGPTVVCIPRNFIAADTVGWPFITSLTRDYVTAITPFVSCQVKFADETPWRQAKWPEDAWLKYDADFALFFDLHTDNKGYSLKCNLVHSHNSHIDWAHSFTLVNTFPESSVINPIFKRIAHDTIGAERGIAQDYWVRQLLASGKPIASHHQVVVAARQYAWDISPANFRTSLCTCEQRLAKFPHDVAALISYADHCRVDYLLKYQQITPLYACTATVADTLLQLAPGNAYSHLFQAMSCLFKEDYDECLTALAQAQAINSLDTHLNILTGLIHLALGDWQTGMIFIQDSVAISPNHPDWYHIPMCIDHYHKGNYLAAMQEAKKVRLKHIWSTMLRTALYSFTKQPEKTAIEYHKLVDEHPDYVQEGQKLTQGFTQPTNQVFHQIWSNIPNQSPNKNDDNRISMGNDEITSDELDIEIFIQRNQ